MTRLAVMSDLHIDLNHFETYEIDTLIKCLKDQKVTRLHIAGDISNHYFIDTKPFLHKLSKEVKVTSNLGNHDMLDLEDNLIDNLDFQVIDLGSMTLLTFHGWYDYSYSGEKLDKILKRKKQLWFDRRLKRLGNDPEICHNGLKRLDDILNDLDTSKLIVAMHFVPHNRFTMTHERFKPFNAFLGSEQFHKIFVKHSVKDVVFGHAHRSYGTVTIDGVTYHSRPLGYRREWDLTIDFVSNHPELNPTGTWNLSKRYNLVKKRPEFLDYEKKELANEFLSSMTLFDL
ncbi:metallophosphoesterase [Streptococcus thermophilus]|uniref:metallophosphoesterase n=1 Tax=Streptococcus thermophilus TaxID=1308 RepID=UPI0015D790DE|nr:metallophosphoesterase [Streptococcus thermophilus]MBZ5770503.1 metallophosphoesterase [Streptococcus thermophilus]MBZ5812975.1 metallophosphoesterase [Streptococcus thermophilus]MCE2158327.1 phosphoesterase [Streptococcus thermophilus]MCE2166812.1 phosphoesterase [Streptococcus thermophilus]MCE2168402.1 phosphoesterase [Streptococcus thermophilus]